MKKIIPIVIVLVLVGAAFYWYGKSSKQVEAPLQQQPVSTGGSEGENRSDAPKETPKTEEAPKENTSQPKSQSQSTYSDGSEAEGLAPDIMVVEVVFDGDKFSPKTTTVKAGDIVIFKNESSNPFWPASGPHPDHTALAGFDSGKSLVPGGEYQYKFTKKGSWSYHDHLNPSVTGTIIVE